MYEVVKVDIVFDNWRLLICLYKNVASKRKEVNFLKIKIDIFW